MTNAKAPSFLTTAGELLTPLEFERLFRAAPSLMRQKKGSGEPVLVLPGMAASNLSTKVLRAYLSWLGYEVHGWNLGRNNGRVKDMFAPVAAQVQQLYSQENTKVHLIGWSLGGIIAREVARDFPYLVSQVITMGSPIVGGPKYTSFRSFYESRGVDLDQIDRRIAEREKRAIRVPVTSIYSKQDGIVGWQASIDNINPMADNIEVSATHLGLGISPDVFKIIGRKLLNRH
jgi:pimeloyl-ACP methyl ester carboxylesterase